MGVLVQIMNNGTSQAVVDSVEGLDGNITAYIARTVTDSGRKMIRDKLTKKEAVRLSLQLAANPAFIGYVVLLFEGKRWIATKHCTGVKLKRDTYQG